MEHIDKIFYINLKKRVDRLQQIEAELSNMAFSQSVCERFEADERGQIGCIQSHIGVLRLAKKRHYRNVLILEDDFRFLVSRETFDHEVGVFFGKRLDFYVLMLSHHCLSTKPWDEQVSIGTNCQDGAGYIVNASAYDGLIYWLSYGSVKLLHTGSHWLYMNDQIWKKMQTEDKWFVMNRKMGEQNGSASDLANTIVSCLGGEVVITKG